MKYEELMSLNSKKEQMDSLDRGKKIEEITLSLLSEIFEPFSLKRDVYKFGRKFDGSISLSRKTIFFEIKIGFLADFELKRIQQINLIISGLYMRNYILYILPTVSKINDYFLKEANAYSNTTTFIDFNNLIELHRFVNERFRENEPALEEKRLFFEFLFKENRVIEKKAFESAITYMKHFKRYQIHNKDPLSTPIATAYYSDNLLDEYYGRIEATIKELQKELDALKKEVQKRRFLEDQLNRP